MIRERSFDLLCCHGAEVTNYNKPEFDFFGAVINNSYRLPDVLDTLVNASCSKILLTGSVLEHDEGTGSTDLHGFLSLCAFEGRYLAAFSLLHSGAIDDAWEIVIADPFGPYEERRFTHYLMKCWSEGTTAAVHTPDYVRDNIHVSLLRKKYAHCAATLRTGISRINPSGYVKSQGAFTHRVATQIRERLDWKCEFALNVQTEFPDNWPCLIPSFAMRKC